MRLWHAAVLMLALAAGSAWAGGTKPIPMCTNNQPDGVSVFLYDTSTTLSGTLTSLGADAIGFKLAKPINVISEGAALDSECKQPVVQLQLSDDLKSQLKGLIGKRVAITGTLIHAYAPQHHTPILIRVDTFSRK